MSFEVTVTPTVYNVEVEVNPSVQPFDVVVEVGNVPDLDLTTNGDSGASTFNPLTGELNIPEYTLGGLGGVPESRTLTINGTIQDLSANRTFTIPTHDAITIGTANGLSLAGQVLSLGLASSIANGALSSTDWATFNAKQNSLGFTPENVANKAINLTSPDDTKYPTTLAVSTALAGKQNTLTNPITGTGTSGQVAFWSGTGTQTGDNGLFWDNTNKRLRINQTTDAGFRLDVNGTARVQGALTTTADATINGLNIGRDGGNIASNTRVGSAALASNTLGTENTASGLNSLFNTTTGLSNTAFGSSALVSNVGGNDNSGFGVRSLANILSTSSANVGMGFSAGRFISDGVTTLTLANNSVFIGVNTRALADNQTNQIVIGHTAIGAGSNTATLGNTSIVDTILRGRINLQQYATASRPAYVKGALIYDSTLSKLVVGGATDWEVVTSI